MATEDDLPIILRFIQDLAVYERLRDKCVANLDKLRKTLFTNPPAAEVLIARIDELSLETTGTFRHANGQALPW